MGNGKSLSPEALRMGWGSGLGCGEGGEGGCNTFPFGASVMVTTRSPGTEGHTVKFGPGMAHKDLPWSRTSGFLGPTEPWCGRAWWSGPPSVPPVPTSTPATQVTAFTSASRFPGTHSGDLWAAVSPTLSVSSRPVFSAS